MEVSQLTSEANRLKDAWERRVIATLAAGQEKGLQLAPLIVSSGEYLAELLVNFHVATAGADAVLNRSATRNDALQWRVKGIPEGGNAWTELRLQ